MKSLRVGEAIKETFTVKCRFGKSVFYISNLGIMIENNNGSILNLEHKVILSLQPFEGKSVKIIWKENNKAFDFIFICDKPIELTTKYKIVSEEYYSSDSSDVKIIDQAEQIMVKNPVLRPI